MENKTEGFRNLLDSRLGMFVHYGIYSAMAGYYNEQAITGLGEWIQRTAKIPNADYEDFGRKNFYPDVDFAKNLVKCAKEAGIKYIVLTSKHHDGFCLFKSEVSDYSTYGFFGRDICKEVAEECRREGLGVGFYYSHTLDWHEKDAGGNLVSEVKMNVDHRNSWDFPDNNINFEKYLTEKCFPQVRELLTNYGDLELIWFDFPHDITKEQSKRLRDLVKSIQPDCLINSRIGHNLSDYESLEDNALPYVPVKDNTECLITLNDTWGYKKDDKNYKTPETVIDILCHTLTSDSTLLVNVGPMGDGSLTPETKDILVKMGEWTKRNEEAVYGRITGNPLSVIFYWGYLTVKDNKLFACVKDKTQKEIMITGIKGNIKSVSLIGSDDEITYRLEGETLIIEQIENEMTIPVYKVEFLGAFEFDNRIIQCGDEFSLCVLWARKVKRGYENNQSDELYFERNRYIDDYGKHGLCVNKDVMTDFWTDTDEILCWDAYFTEAGDYDVTVVHKPTYVDFVGTLAKGKFNISLGKQTNAVNMEEEKENCHHRKTQNCNSRICRDGGIFTVEKPGQYRVMLSHDGDGDNLLVASVEFRKI